MRTIILAAIAMLAIGGCSAQPTPGASTSSPSPLGMREACAQAEAAVPSDPMPEPKTYATAADKIHQIVLAGDRESKNAFTMLETALRNISAVSEGQPYLDADQQLLHTLDTIASRCKTAGSSAFQ
jgi:hypothetical protein